MNEIVNASAQQEASAQLVLANEWCAGLEQVVITSDEMQEQATAVVRKIKVQLKALEAKREEATIPMNAALRAVNSWFHPPRERFEYLEKLLKRKIADYLQSKQQANIAALEAARTATTPQQATAAIARVEMIAPPKGVSVRQVWKFEITNPDLVPYELCSPDPKKIGAAFQVVNGQPVPVPGVRWYQDTSVSVRK